MHDINFIKHAPKPLSRSCKRWIAYSSILLSITTVSIGYISYLLAQSLHTLQDQKNMYAKNVEINKKHMNEQTALLKHKDELLKQLHKITHRTQTPKNPLETITAIAGLCNTDLQLQSCSIAQKNIELSIACTSANEATQLHAALSALPSIADSELLHISKQNNSPNVLCTIKAKVK